MAKNRNSTGCIVGEMGAAALAAAAASAGYYFYGSDDAKKHRKAATKWAEGLRTDVMKQTKKIKTLDAKTVAAIVDQATAAYKKMGKADAAELARAAGELKANWQRVAVAKLPAVRKAVKGVRAAVKGRIASSKKAAKKTVSRAKKAVKKAAKRRR
jgi:hypothetical protein